MAMLTTPRPYFLSDSDIITGEGDTRYILRVRDLPLEDKPREKLLAAGSDNVSSAELLAIVLGVGTKKEEVMTMAHRIFHEYGERSIVSEKNPRRLAETLEIPLGKACQIVASFELGRRSFQQKFGKSVFVSTARQGYEHLKTMGHLQKEQLRGLYLNSRYQVIHEEVISVGSLTANIVHPREVFQPALEYGAAAVIIAHNHPSGSLEPTDADLEATEQLREAGRVLGIDLLDHLIIAGEGFISLAEREERNG
ncbi:MAG TPA: DNA repair protein RadC [Candidatus Saccharimonadales bacterium]